MAVVACGESLNQEEIDCEDAMAHLASCCLGFNPSRFMCVQASAGCAPDIALAPAFDLATSDCIRAEGCAHLAESGVCARALELGNVDAGASSGQLCP